MVTNVELDHHSRWSSRAELLEAFRAFCEPARGLALPGDGSLDGLAGEQRVLAFDPDRPGPALDLPVPGRHNLLNARAALAALELAGFELEPRGTRACLLPGDPAPPGAEGASERGRRSTTTTRTTRPRSRRPSRRFASSRPRRLIAVFQPHLYSRTKALAERFGAALAAADEVGVLDVYPAREQPVGPLAGVSGLAVARAAADHARGRPVWWLVDADRAARALWRRVSARATFWSRSAPATSSSSPTRWWRTMASREPPDDAPGRSRARLPAGAADHRAGRRAGGPVRPPGRRGRARRAAPLGGVGGGRRSQWSARARTCWSPTTGIAAWC